jgi:hypothetical protein
MNVEGGEGVYRNDYTRSLSSAGTKRIFERIKAKGFTGTAFVTLSENAPYPIYRDIVFEAANDATTLCIVHAGQAQHGIVTGCLFRFYRVGLKLLQPWDFKFFDNDILQLHEEPANERVAVWLVPMGANGEGTGFDTTGPANKFGNEWRKASTDYRFLFADEGAGTWIGDKWPNLAADSAGFISGARITGDKISHIAGETLPIVYSTTPNVRSSKIGDFELDGSSIPALLNYRTPPANGNRNDDPLLLPSAYSSEAGHTIPVAPLTNSKTAKVAPDPRGATDGWSLYSPLSFPGSAHPSGATDITVPSLSGATEKGKVTDGEGVPEGAIEWEMTASLTTSAIEAAKFKAGIPLWLMFEIGAGGSEPLSDLYVALREGATDLHSSIVKPPVEGFRPYIIPFALNSPPGSALKILMKAPASGATGSRIKIGRRIYLAQSWTPQIYDFVHRGHWLAFFGHPGGPQPIVKPPAEVSAKELCEALESLGLVE